MAGIKNIIVSFILIGIFAMSMITFGIQTGIDNSSNISIADDLRIQSFNSSLYNSQKSYTSDVGSANAAFNQSEPTRGSEGLQLLAIPSIVKTLIKTPVTIYNLTFGFVIDTIFGSNPLFDVIFTMLSALIIGIVIMYMWKFIRGGSPD